MDNLRLKLGIIDNIFRTEKILDKVCLFELYKKELAPCKIYLFDVEQSSFGDEFKNISFGKNGIVGLTDYSKTWILSTEHDNAKRSFGVYKTIDFDLNVLTYLHRIISPRGAATGFVQADVEALMKYIKEKDFQVGMTTALIERVSKKLDLNIFAEMICSYVKYERYIEYGDDYHEYVMTEEDYNRAKLIYELGINSRENVKKLNSFYGLCCCIGKAMLLKNIANKTTEEKIIDLILYCEGTLSCIFEKEIVILSRYLSDDPMVSKQFEKLRKTKLGYDERIKNVAWDLYHIRLLEEMFLNDNSVMGRDEALPYYASADQGLLNSFRLNPLKGFVFLEGSISYPVNFLKLEDVCKNETVIQNVHDRLSTRLEECKSVDAEKEFRNILMKLELGNSYFDSNARS